MQDNDTVLWRMIGASGRVLECVVRFAPGGIEVAIRTDGKETFAQRFTTGTEAMAFAEQARVDLERKD